MAASRSAGRPGALEPGPQRGPEVGQVPGAVGVVGGGGLHGLAARPRWRRPGRPCAPVRSNRARSAVPRLDRYAARSGWSAGVACDGLRRLGWRRPGRLPPRCARTGRAARSRGWTGTRRGRGGRRGWPAWPAGRRRWRASRSPAAPVRSNRVRSAFPRLDRYAARSGWSAGVACTASRRRSMAASRSVRRPGALEPGVQRGPEVGQVPGAVGVVGGGGLHGLLAGLDGGVQVGLPPRCARTGPAARSRGWTGTWRGRGGRRGWPARPRGGG